MSDNELINQFILSQQKINTDLATGLADIRRGQVDMSERLFGAAGQPGAFGYVKAASDKQTEAVESVAARTVVLETWKRDIKVWLGACVSIVTTEATVLAFWFNNLAHKIHIP